MTIKSTGMQESVQLSSTNKVLTNHLPQEKTNRPRCFGNKVGQELYAKYHDEEWGVPQHDDRLLFEMLILEGAQAGLSWETILRKREGYRAAFHDFEVEAVAAMTDDALEEQLSNPEIVRHRLKIASVRKNALVYLNIQALFGSFDEYLWRYVDGQPIINSWESFDSVPVKTKVSEALSKDLKERGMTFVGPTIMYAYMQAVGMVNDHYGDCWLARS